MKHDFAPKIAWLEAKWSSPHGVIEAARYGELDWAEAQLLVDTIRSWASEIPDDELLPPRFVALLWSIPTYIDSHRARIQARGADPQRLDQFRADVFDAVSSVLGLP